MQLFGFFSSKFYQFSPLKMTKKNISKYLNLIFFSLNFYREQHKKFASQINRDLKFSRIYLPSFPFSTVRSQSFLFISFCANEITSELCGIVKSFGRIILSLSLFFRKIVMTMNNECEFFLFFLFFFA